MAAFVHVISKSDNTKPAIFELDNSLPPLAESSVRVRSSFISLTSNNLSYARAGTLLHWWDAYPVPSTAPTPYNNRDEWGIVPAWGHAQVLESTISSIAPGSMLWGFWPTSSYPVDLKLQVAEPKGHWIETSGQRSKLMSAYNRYKEIAHKKSSTEPPEEDTLAVACKPVWEAGYMLNRYIFPYMDTAPIHPLGVGGLWTAEDADLTSAIVISLSASSKTGRSFAWQILRNRDPSRNGPLALLQATSAPEAVQQQTGCRIPEKTISYDKLVNSDTIAWLAERKPARIIIVDFGASNSTLQALVSTLSASVTFANRPAVTTIAVGHEAKVYSDVELAMLIASARELEKVQFNTSGVRDRAMEVEGPKTYFDGVEEAWRRCVSEGGLGDLEMVWRKGVGEEGILGTWRELCEGKMGGRTVVVKL